MKQKVFIDVNKSNFTLKKYKRVAFRVKEYKFIKRPLHFGQIMLINKMPIRE